MVTDTGAQVDGAQEADVGDGRRGPKWAGRIGAALVLLGLVLAALVPLAEADDRAYAAASDCPAGTRADTCRVVTEATVTYRKDERTGKSDHYILVLDGQR